MLPHKYILNFPNDNVRKTFIENQFTKQNINDYTIIEGVNGFTLNLDKYKFNLNRKIFRQLKKGECGCLLGHTKIYKTAIDNKQSTILVMEDDITICEDFDENLKQQLATIPTDYDIAFLSSTRIWNNKYKNKCVLEDVNDDYYKLVKGFHYGAHTYVIKESAMKKILECEIIIYPIDLLLGELGLNVYISKMQLSHQTIGMGSYTQSNKKLK